MRKSVACILNILLLLAILLQLPQLSYAGREPEEWDTLPQIENIVFSKTSVGFISRDQRYFVLERTNQILQLIEKDTFLQLFPNWDRKKPSEIIKNEGIGSGVLLRASNGMEFKAKNAYCSEGEDIHHELWMQEKVVVDQAEPCSSISTVEIVGNQLWLGTRYDGEYGDYPAQGVIIQSLREGNIIEKIGNTEGLTGDLIRVIRIDPYSQNIWVITQRGFNEIDKSFKIANAKYFYEDFNPATGKPVVLLSTVAKQSNPFAVVERLLAIKDTKAFYNAVSQIPKQTQAQFSLYNFHAGIYLAANIRAVKESFVPKDMNILIPFFIEAAQSGQEQVRLTALSMACMFNDKRIFDFFTNLEKNIQPHGPGTWYIRDCLKKYEALGLARNGQSIQHKEVGK